MQAIFLLEKRFHPEVYGAALTDEMRAACTLLDPILDAKDWRSATPEQRAAEVIFASWGMARVDEEFLQHFPALKFIFYAAGSIRYFTTDALWARGIRVCTAAAANAESVAEFTLGQILLGLKQTLPLARSYTLGLPMPAIMPPGNFRTTVGLLSLGLIGRRVARLLQAFTHQVVAYDPYASPEMAAQLGIRLVGLEELFQVSDLVSCHVPLLDTTRGLLRGHHFASMKTGAVFLNTARGGVVAEAELCAVLAQRPDLYAMLDVTDPEPPLADSPLRTLPNVLLTPHLAGCRDRECLRMGRMIVDEFHRYRLGEPLLHEVTQARAALLA